MSKPIYPFSLSEYPVADEEAYVAATSSNFNSVLHSDMRSAHAFTGVLSPGLLNLGGTPQRETSRRSGHSSMDFTDASGPLEAENLYGGSRCGICERSLS